MKHKYPIFDKILVIQTNNQTINDIDYIKKNIIYSAEGYNWIDISNIKINFLSLVRVFEKFYVISDEQGYDNSIVYDSISKHYQDIIDIEKNIEANKTLCHILTKHVNIKKAVDFGCGTGLSYKFFEQNNIDVLGVDKSIHMLKEAKINGFMNTCHISLFSHEKYLNQFNGAIASYVFHILQDYNDLEVLSRTLKHNAIIVANFFKNKNISFINKYFKEHNWSITIVKTNSKFNHGEIYVYRRTK